MFPDVDYRAGVGPILSDKFSDLLFLHEMVEHRDMVTASPGMALLESRGISRETARQRVEEAVGRGQQAPSGHIPFTRQSKKVLELALEESRALGHNYIGTEHVLLALLREGTGVAAQVLGALGADLDAARAEVTRLLDEHRRQSG